MEPQTKRVPNLVDRSIRINFTKNTASGGYLFIIFSAVLTQNNILLVKK